MSLPEDKLLYLERELCSLVELIKPETLKFYREHPELGKVTSRQAVRKCLIQLLQEVEGTRCFASFKEMYFCDKPEGHEGPHGETGLGPW